MVKGFGFRVVYGRRARLRLRSGAWGFGFDVRFNPSGFDGI